MQSHIDGWTESCDTVDGGLLCTLRPRKSSIQEAATSIFAPYYNMGHPKRGLAVIFNNETFAMNNLPPRFGTKVDSRLLSECLTEFGFQIKLYDDCKLEKIKEVLKKVAEKNHDDHDCLVVAVLTYERSGRLCAKDDYYTVDLIWSSFTADKCLTLASKPKIFFVQACQSEKLSTGNTDSDRSKCDGQGSVGFRLPVNSDILLAYSTVPGFYNLDYTQQGSWFIKALCSELSKNGAVESLLTVLCSVFRRVAENLEQDYDNNFNSNKEHEIPNFTATLIRLIKFTPKIELYY